MINSSIRYARKLLSKHLAERQNKLWAALLIVCTVLAVGAFVSGIFV